MGLLDLTLMEFLDGSFCLLYVIIVTVLGIKIMSKYFEHKRLELMIAGLASIFGFAGPFWGNAASIITYALFDYMFEFNLIVSLGAIFSSLGLLLLALLLTHFVHPRLKKIIILIFSTICILYIIFIIYSLIIDPTLLGTTTEIDKFCRHCYEPSIYINIYSLFAFISIFVVFSTFFMHCQKSEDPKIRWQGRFILIFLISYISALLLEYNATTSIILILVRLLLISSAVEFYLGFFLPEWVARRLIKQDYESLEVSTRKTDKLQEFLQFLKTKPEKFTEEEVMFHKEKKICLVCKGKVGGFNIFVCTKCDTLYCGNCAKALSQLENACWVCNAPFDKSLPVKSYKKAEEEVEVEELDKALKKQPKK